VPALRIRRHRAAVFILGDRAREAIGRRHGARAQRRPTAPAASSVAGATDSARPRRPRLRWARSLRDRACGRRRCRRLNLLPKKGPVASASCLFSRAREAQPSAPPAGVDLTLRVFGAEVAAGAEQDQLPGSHRDRRRIDLAIGGRSRVLALRIRRHRAAVFILGDRAREPIGRRDGARAQRPPTAPAESSVAGATDNARP
jgi:hypothetical protein